MVRTRTQKLPPLGIFLFLTDTTIVCRALHVSTFRPHPPWLASAPFSSAYHHSVCGGTARHPSTEAEGQAHPYVADKLRAGPGGANAPADEDELNMLRSQCPLHSIRPCILPLI